MPDMTFDASIDGPGDEGSGHRLMTAADTARETTSHPDHTANSTIPARRCVLIVDDNIDAAMMLEALLTMTGYKVVLAHDGQSAVHLAQQCAPDAVVLDIGLPDLDGFETARQIRVHSSQVLLIALTGRDGDDDRDSSRMAGFNHYLVKPVSIEALSTLLA